MTDNNATELLRAMLDERGVEWRDEPYEDVLKVTVWTVGETLCEYNETPKAHLTFLEETINPCTPEQAIVATLGTDDGSRWHELFGTPESAAASLCDILTCTKTSCDECCINEICDDATHPYNNDMKATLLEWLRGKVVS